MVGTLSPSSHGTNQGYSHLLTYQVSPPGFTQGSVPPSDTTGGKVNWYNHYGEQNSGSVSPSVMSDSETPWMASPRLLCPWAFPGKNTGVGSHFFLQGIFPTQGLNPHLLHWPRSFPYTVLQCLFENITPTLHLKQNTILIKPCSLLTV